MSVTYTRATRLPGERNGRGGATVVMAPVIDRSTVDTSLLLRCDHPASVSVGVSGLPVPEVTWYVGAQRIQDSSEFRVSMETGGRRHTLSITKVTEELEKGIAVRAVNSAGHDQMRIDIKTYKFLTGRSAPETTKTATLPLFHSFQSEISREPDKAKTIQRYKSFSRYEMTQQDYESWQKEMEKRSQMRSIDDIIDNLSSSSSEADAAEIPSIENLSSEAASAEPRGLGDQSTPLPPRPPSSDSAPANALLPAATTNHSNDEPRRIAGSHLLPSSPSAAAPSGLPVNRGFRLPFADPPLPSRDPSAKRHADVITQTPEADRRYPPQCVDPPLWEIFGVRLSDFCRNILAVSDRGEAPVGQGRVHRSQSPERLDPTENTSLAVQTRSLPTERKFLGSRDPDSNADPAGLVGSKAPDAELSRRDSHPRAAAAVSGAKRPSSRPPLAPKPSFLGARNAMSSSEVDATRIPSAPAISHGPSYPHVSYPNRSPVRADLAPLPPRTTDALQRTTDHKRLVVEESNQLALQNSSSAAGSAGSTHGAHGYPVGEIPVSAAGRMVDPASSSSRCRSTEVLETHFSCSPEPEHVGRSMPTLKPEVPPQPEVINRSGARWTGAAADRLPPSPRAADFVRKKPPIAKDKPIWNPGSGSRTSAGTSRPSPSACRKDDVAQSRPAASVRRARSQSSGRTDEEDTSGGAMSGSVSARQLLSHSQEFESSLAATGSEDERQGVVPPVGLGRLHSSAAKSEGLLTVRKRSVSPSSGAGAVNRNGGREWSSSAVLPVSRSVDVLDARNMEGMPRIGRRSLSKEWNIVTVTTKEEIVIVRRPSSAATTAPGAVRSADQKLCWKLPLESCRPFAV